MNEKEREREESMSVLVGKDGRPILQAKAQEW